ncbi:PAS domain S-box protein [Bacteroidetes/Chlorobi group bacterium Naka2016]|jgi:PAS domain S-box-containing protein|nr:MAG: PAS domain S-box protein [Bacteroidetes/Chlorobi group bacterium Naka2016]
MNAIIIGGGKGCYAILKLLREKPIKELNLQVLGVVDINPEAEGLKYAKELGLKTFSNYKEALNSLDVEVVIELTGNNEFVKKLKQELSPEIKLIEHSIAHIFWDLMYAHEELDRKIEDLQRLEKVIENDNVFLKSIFDSFQDLTVVMDLEQRITRANKAFCEFVGLPEEQVIGQKCYHLLEIAEINCDKKGLEEIINYIKETKKPHTMVHYSAQPKESYWEVTRSPIFDVQGEVKFILSNWHRITELVYLKREVETLEQKLKSFINNAQDWISMKNLNGEYILVNPVIAKAFGKQPEDFIGKKPEDVLPMKIAQTVKAHDSEVLRTGKAILYDETIMLNGEEHYFRMLRFPLTDSQGKIIGTCTIGRDATNEIQLMEKLVQSEKLVALGKLAAGVAHEINNPLTGILSYAESISEELDKDNPLQEDIAIIIRETLRCRDIVRNLLDFAKQSTPKFEIVDPNSIIKQSLDLISRLPQFKDIEIEVLLEEKVPQIKADSKQIQQVILNFLINAADAMKYKGKITISTEYYRQQKKCVISVEDTGPGIPENLMDKIFEPFFSTKSTSGLGLAVSWGIIERHHGTIEVDTAPTGGAIFRILLPAYFEIVDKLE